MESFALKLMLNAKHAFLPCAKGLVKLTPWVTLSLKNHLVEFLYFVQFTCKILSSAMKVPDLPTPAEQWTTIGRCSALTRSRNARTNRTRVWGGSGTPKSGHVVKWKCRIVRTVSPRMILNSETFQSGKWLSFRIVTWWLKIFVVVVVDLLLLQF